MMEQELNHYIYEHKEEIMFFIGFLALIVFLDRDKK